MRELMLCVMVAVTCVLGQIGERDQPAVSQAEAYFRSNAAQYGLDDLRVALKARKVNRDAKGVAHVRFDQYIDGIRVFEGESIAHVGTNSRISVTDAIRKKILAGSKPSLDKSVAQKLAIQAVKLRGSKVVRAELEILPQGRIEKDTLVWHFRLFSRHASVGAAQRDVFVDAITGREVWKFDSLQTATVTGTGYSMFSGTVPLTLDEAGGSYFLLDPGRGHSDTRDLVTRRRGDGEVVSAAATTMGVGSVENTDPYTAAVDAHYALATTWDYFLKMFGRNGIDGKGRPSSSLVHYGKKYENAFWSDDCFCMTYGDGDDTFYPLVGLDVAGHEMAHGVMSTEANLTYDGESGGLNEANSDIFGSLVEFYANNAVDAPDYWVGERILRSNYSTGTYVQKKALRYMDDPEKDGASPACWYDRLKRLNVHYSSGPANHMFICCRVQRQQQGSAIPCRFRALAARRQRASGMRRLRTT